jgi:hypothetical protein
MTFETNKDVLDRYEKLPPFETESNFAVII